jgi:hypothetical protein
LRRNGTSKKLMIQLGGMFCTGLFQMIEF